MVTRSTEEERRAVAAVCGTVGLAAGALTLITKPAHGPTLLGLAVFAALAAAAMFMLGRTAESRRHRWLLWGLGLFAAWGSDNVIVGVAGLAIGRRRYLAHPLAHLLSGVVLLALAVFLAYRRRGRLV